MRIFVRNWLFYLLWKIFKKNDEQIKLLKNREFTFINEIKAKDILIKKNKKTLAQSTDKYIIYFKRYCVFYVSNIFLVQYKMLESYLGNHSIKISNCTWRGLSFLLYYFISIFFLLSAAIISWPLSFIALKKVAFCHFFMLILIHGRRIYEGRKFFPQKFRIFKKK